MMSDSEHEDQQEPKIVIDTDWKDQVAREKEVADAASGDSDDQSAVVPDSDTAADQTIDVSTDVSSTDESTDESTEESTDVSSDSGGDRSDGEMPAPPPASFDVLLSMLFTQAMAMLGQMPDPASGKTTINKQYAKHYIDTLDMLTEKTKGNLNDDESKMLSEALHALRMMYVNVRA
jgi:hypothetical protein